MVKKSFGSIEQKSLAARMHQYEIAGRAAPTEKIPVPKIFKMKLFAKNAVLARSKFWYFMKRINCAKRSGGQILRMTELFDKAPTRVQNYGVWLRYESRTDTHNMYKEFRDTTITGAIGQMVAEMAGRHRAQASAIQILKTTIVPNEKVRRPHVLQMLKKTVKFPVVRKLPMNPKGERKLVRASRYTTFAQ
jgi:large subunit ribosomal protein L18Ae